MPNVSNIYITGNAYETFSLTFYRLQDNQLIGTLNHAQSPSHCNVLF